MEIKNQKTVNSLTEKIDKSIGKSKIEFATRLHHFIVGKTDNENEQKNLLEIAKKQFAEVDFDKINADCKICRGRGFTGYNRTFKYYTICPKCLTN